MFSAGEVKIYFFRKLHVIYQSRRFGIRFISLPLSLSLSLSLSLPPDTYACTLFGGVDFRGKRARGWKANRAR